MTDATRSTYLFVVIRSSVGYTAYYPPIGYDTYGPVRDTPFEAIAALCHQIQDGMDIADGEEIDEIPQQI